MSEPNETNDTQTAASEVEPTATDSTLFPGSVSDADVEALIADALDNDSGTGNSDSAAPPVDDVTLGNDTLPDTSLDTTASQDTNSADSGLPQEAAPLIESVTTVETFPGIAEQVEEVNTARAAAAIQSSIENTGAGEVVVAAEYAVTLNRVGDERVALILTSGKKSTTDIDEARQVLDIAKQAGAVDVVIELLDDQMKALYGI